MWDLGPPSKRLMEVDHLLPKPMLRYRFTKFTKELFGHSGGQVADVGGVCTSGERRARPTAANLMRLSLQDAPAPGSRRGERL